MENFSSVCSAARGEPWSVDFDRDLRALCRHFIEEGTSVAVIRQILRPSLAVRLLAMYPKIALKMSAEAETRSANLRDRFMLDTLRKSQKRAST